MQEVFFVYSDKCIVSSNRHATTTFALHNEKKKKNNSSSNEQIGQKFCLLAMTITQNQYS